MISNGVLALLKQRKDLCRINSLNVKMFNDILFRTTFSEDAKSKFVNGTQKRNNTLVQSEIKAEFKINGKWGVYTSYGSIDALKMNNDFSKLVFLAMRCMIIRT